MRAFVVTVATTTTIRPSLLAGTILGRIIRESGCGSVCLSVSLSVSQNDPIYFQLIPKMCKFREQVCLLCLALQFYCYSYCWCFFIVFLLRMLTIIIHLRLSYLTLTLTLKKFRCKSVLCDGVNYSDHNDYHPQHFVFTLKSLKLTCVAQLVERLSLTGEISLYYARPACSCWVYRPL